MKLRYFKRAATGISSAGDDAVGRALRGGSATVAALHVCEQHICKSLQPADTRTHPHAAPTAAYANRDGTYFWTAKPGKRRQLSFRRRHASSAFGCGAARTVGAAVGARQRCAAAERTRLPMHARRERARRSRRSVLQVLPLGRRAGGHGHRTGRFWRAGSLRVLRVLAAGRPPSGQAGLRDPRRGKAAGAGPGVRRLASAASSRTRRRRRRQGRRRKDTRRRGTGLGGGGGKDVYMSKSIA